jgi:hypothetical protein
MIVSEVKGLHSPDIVRLESEQPEDPSLFSILVEVRVGPKDEPGEESFDVVVCTPAWISSCLASTPYVAPRHHLLVPKYDYEIIRTAIYQVFDGVKGKHWTEVAQQLARYGRWEFEDYQPFVQSSNRSLG